MTQAQTNNGTSSDGATAGAAGELKRLKQAGGATVDELREFLAKMRGKSPQEVLGVVSGSSLIGATVQATIWCVVLLAAFTAGPYAWNQVFPPPAVEVAKQPPAAAAAANTPAAANAPAADDAAKTADGKSGGAAASPQNNLEQAAKKMGMDEAKPADPKKNPLENNLDSLLDKLE